MRIRNFVLSSALAVLLVSAAAPATADSTVGELTAAFHAAGNGGEAIEAHNARALAVAAPVTIIGVPEGRIVPFVGDPRQFCDTDLVGTWVSVFDSTRESLKTFDSEFILDGEVLDTKRTSIRRLSPSVGDGWWLSQGVPVLGTLPIGSYTLEWNVLVDDMPVFTVFTDIEVSEAFC